mmetsp:Transcript_14404/g.45404  ORF Transcript_14404/g.45404 Transcript_14404/m.45404 type:complete len:255 (-) Transcript_14404:109-873(-)
MPRARANESGAGSGGVALAVSTIKSKDYLYHQGGGEMRALVLSTAKSLGSLPISEAAKKEVMESLVKTMSEGLELKFTVDDFIAALDTLPSELSEEDQQGDMAAAYEAKLEEAMEARAGRIPASIKNDSQYKRLDKMAAPILRPGSDNDDDCLIDETQDATEASLKDPYTRQLFQDPMRSTKCGHVYSLATVNTYFKTSSLCAHPGCNWKLTVADFERDAETQLLLRRFKQQAASQAQPADVDEIDDDDDDDAL